MLDRAAIEIHGRPLKIKAETVRKAMDVAYIIDHRHTSGGPGKRQVTSMLRKRSLRMARERKWLAAERERLDAARNLVESLARTLTKR